MAKISFLASLPDIQGAIRFGDKKCSLCGKLKDRSEFYRRKASPDGLRTECKSCQNERNQKYASEHIDQIRKYKREWIAAKPRTDETRAYNRSQYRKHRTAILKHAAEFRQSPEQKQKRRDYNALYCNRIRATELRSQRRRTEEARAKRRARRNDAHITRRVRAISRAAPGSHSVAQWRTLLILCGPYCLRCGELCPNPSVDHVVSPLDGGTHYIANIQPLCVRCNSRKNRHSVDYRPAPARKWAMSAI